MEASSCYLLIVLVLLQADFDNSRGVALLVSKIGRLAKMVGSTVWGVRVEEGRTRCARLTLTPHKLYLSALREGDPPRYSHVLPVSTLYFYIFSHNYFQILV